MEITNTFEVNGTLVANEFIDRHMAAASGEYVKVYLYLLRHRNERTDITAVAEALGHTEADVRRALAYWERAGVIKTGAGKPDAAQRGLCAAPQQTSDAAQSAAAPSYSAGQVSRLSGDDEFTQLLYIAQKYMNRIFTQRDVQVFAYLYDSLHMSTELLEYVVEHCVQSGHTSVRYIETVAISWHGKGFSTVEEARAYAESFTGNTFSVMKAFGLTNRKPGGQETEMIERWFHSYGFSKELILEACNRTMAATHTPSFQYADKILSGWKKAGVKTMEDVAALDETHQTRARQAAARSQKKPANQFHNFEQRDTDYDTIMLEQVKAWTGR